MEESCTCAPTESRGRGTPDRTTPSFCAACLQRLERMANAPRETRSTHPDFRPVDKQVAWSPYPA